MPIQMTILLIFLACMSFIAFVFYGIDKRKAKKEQWRIKEAVLLSLGFFGGAVGALIGMNVFHHKTKHIYFWIINILGLACQIAITYFFIVKFC